MDFEEGLSADEILNMEFPVEYSNDDRWIRINYDNWWWQVINEINDESWQLTMTGE